jgi:hypothetical protein
MFTLLPLLACIPYGWSAGKERVESYLANEMIRCGRKNYYLCKYIATFLSGAIAVTIPLIFNLLLTAMFLPAIKPDVDYLMYYAVRYGAFAADLLYTHPLLYVAVYLCLDFIFAGLFACMSMALGNFINHSIPVLVLPFMGLLALRYAKSILFYEYHVEISPLDFLHSTAVINPTKGWIVLLEGSLFLILTFIAGVKMGEKRDVL